MQDLAELARLDEIDFYLDPHPVYQRLRREAPVFWCESGSFWALSKYEDIRYVAAHPELFCSSQGFQIGDHTHPERFAMRAPGGAEDLLGSDPPRHGQLRRLISKAFTPGTVRQLEPRIREITCEALDEIRTGEVTDFVEAISVPVPLCMIAELVGFPWSERERFKAWTDTIVEFLDHNPGDEIWERVATVWSEMHSYFATTLEERRHAPQDDLVSALLAAEIEGEKLTENTILVFLVNLMAAGNETTRTLLSGGALTLAQYPQEWKKLRANPEFLPRAVDEMLRWWSPVTTFCRTATEDVVIRGQTIKKGDFVVMLFASGNRDEDAWADADVFDVERMPEPMHVAFGWGEHVCLGASLARLEARVVYEELLQRFGGWEVARPARRKPSKVINSITELPVVFFAEA
jgi:cytochrome P450